MERNHRRSARPHARRHALLVVALAVSLVTQAPWISAHAASTNIPSATQPVVGPEAVLERYVRAFRGRSPEGIGAVLTADYRFHQRGDSLTDFLGGKDRDTEIGTIRSFLLGVEKDGVVVMPAPDSLSLMVDGVTQRFDPEHPDSSEHYRLLTVRRMDLRIVLPGDQVLETLETLNTFHVVRGDAAVLAAGQTADPSTWYIRRWLSDVTGVITAMRERGEPCGEPEPGAPDALPAANSPRVPTVLAIRPLIHPACALLSMMCDLPGNEPARVEVYDVSGRRVHQREVRVASAGAMTIDAGRGARIVPGVYWVRLSQAARKPSTRMVVVSR